MYDRVLDTPQHLLWFVSTDIPHLTQIQMTDIRVEPIFTEWMDQHGVENQKHLFADSKYMSSQ